ncbi:MAG: efflux RND transporter permease subunit [Acidobacteria bacterium]|nr:efflux RND transporter permease subunit [Acidobacteriota bacterium]
MSLPRTAVRRPVTMTMISAVVILLGAVALVRLPVDLMPDVTFPSLSVNVTYADVGPLEMEELVTRPLEQTVSAIAGLEEVTSTSQEGSSQIRLNFGWGADLNEAADDLRSRLDRMRNRLPEDAEPPVIFKFDAANAPIMFLGLEGDAEPVALRETAENDLGPRLERVPGVATVTVRGGLRRQIRVELARDKITALDLSVNEIITLLQTENRNIPIGELDDGDMTYLLRSPGQFSSLEDIRNIVVMTRGGIPVYMRDIAEVSDGTEDQEELVRINGRTAVQIMISKQSGRNTVSVARGVRAEIDRINREMPSVRLSTRMDSAIFVERSINAVRNVVLWGAMLVIVVLFAFLRNIRTTLIICTAIPISIIGTFAMVYFAGFTLNTLTFGGLALGVGMIVDASIVVLENTYRHMEGGKDRKTASVDASEEVTGAIVASTLTQVAVFLPLLFLTGVASIMFGQLAMVVMISLAMSLFVAVTLVPVLTSKLLRLPPPPEERRGVLGGLMNLSERGLGWLDDRYQRWIHLALAHRPTVLLVAGALVWVAVMMLSTIPVELTPDVDEGEVRVYAELPIGTRFERTRDVMLDLEERVNAAVPEAVNVTTQVGGGRGPFGGGSSHRGSMTVTLLEKTERERTSNEIAMALRRSLNTLPGVIVRARASGGNRMMTRMMRSGSGEDARLALEIRGHDLEDARQVSERAMSVMSSTEGIADAEMAAEQSRPELAIRVDRSKAALLGLRVSEVADALRTGVAGTEAAFYRERGDEYPIVVRLQEADRLRTSDIQDVPLSTPGGLVIPARSVIDVNPDSGPEQIERKNQERIVRVNAEIETTLSEAVAAVAERIPDIDPPPDFSVGFGAEVEEQARSFGQLQLILILAIVLVYAVMAAQFESFRDPFIILLSIPLAGIGIVGSLMVTGTPFSIQAYMGVIVLGGLVVNNAILLVDYTNILRRRDGMPLRAAVERAGRTRLRPILMTTVTTLLGMVPMALGIGEGSELQAPLARVIIGGLLSSTLVTLVVVPVVYTLFEEGLAGLRRRPQQPVPEVSA